MTIRSAWSLGRGYGGLLNLPSVHWSPDPPEPPAPPVTPVPSPAPPSGQPFIVFHTQEAFNARRDQEARAILREKYSMTEKQLDERLARAKELEDAEAARIKAQQTKEQQLESEKAEAEARAKAADARAAEATRQAEVTGLCARLGFKNLEYAIFEASKPANATKTATELEAHFTEMAKDEGKKAALGLATAPPEIVPVPGSTAPGGPPGGQQPPAPPAPGAPPPGEKSVMEMSTAEFNARLARLG